MERVISVLVLVGILGSVSAGHVSVENYPFKMVLSTDPSYVLHWKLDKEKEEITFVANASSTGWVGFGLSRNGHMIGSDVVIGWLDDNGEFQLHDRFAPATSIPPIDPSQDWHLVTGEAENGFIVMEVKRKFVTCDVEKDLDVTTSTTHLVWSLNDRTKPRSPDILSQHTHQGSSPVNLFGQSEVRSEPEGAKSFVLHTENTTVPDVKTTYWCHVVKLPQDKDRYIYKFGPFIPEASKQKNLVHHMLLYECPIITETHANFTYLTSISASCDSPEAGAVFLCRGAGVLAGWAIGGQDFLYPKDVAFKMGPGATAQYALLEIHYDNPDRLRGFRDSSGMEFSYTTTPPVHRAGVMTLGHHVTPNMVIPPRSEKYDIQGICSGECTREFFGDGAINVFGGLLHTHLAGKTLVLHHYRHSDSCGGEEELPPIDVNLNYDVDYQQVNLFPREVQVQPGDHLVLQCSYNTTERTDVTLGGEGTLDEMCLTFLFYYPYINLSLCTSMPNVSSYVPLQSQLNDNYQNLLDYLNFAFTVRNSGSVKTLLNNVAWTNKTRSELEQSSMTSKQVQVCVKDFERGPRPKFISPPDVKCPYQNEACIRRTSGEQTGVRTPSLCAQIAVGFLAGVFSVHMHYG